MYEGLEIIKPCDNNAKGFTLFELLISISLFTIAAVSITTMLISAFRNNTSYYEVNQALAIAESKIEFLKGCSMDNLDEGYYKDRNNPIKIDGSNGGIYNLEWEISAGSFSKWKIIVTVGWQKFGLDKIVRLEASI